VLSYACWLRSSCTLCGLLVVVVWCGVLLKWYVQRMLCGSCIPLGSEMEFGTPLQDAMKR
jgi:hypothetical protein